MVNNTPRKKRHFCRNIIIVMAFAVLLAGGAFAAARNAHAKAHTHSYRWVTKKNATCKETGYRNYECACGSILNSQTIDKTPHTWNRGSANCTTAKKCTYCGYIAEAAKGHNLTWVTKKAASCTETGYRNYECHCGYVKNSATIDKIPHTWNRGSADCTHDKVCNVCGTIGEAAKGHRTTWVTKKAASCTETGYRNLECPCGYVQSSATIDKTPHNWNRGSADCTNDKVCRDCRTVGEAAKGHSYSWVVKTAASCTTDGLKEHRCACGAVDETKVIDKWGHHYDIPSASCTEDQKCTTCGDIKEYAKGHNWDRPAATCTLPKKCLRCGKIGEAATGQHVGTQWVVVVEPTCHSGGVKEWRCDCGHSLDGCDIPSNNNHNWVVDHTEPGNCVAWGSTYYRCTNDGCKQTKREANIPPTGHANRRWVVTKEPTKTADGVESYICEYCDDVSETRTLYLISYAGNGGKNIPGNQYKSAGVDITLSSATPTRDGYDFKGWGITKSQADYQPGAKYSADARLTLIAVWKEKKFKVSYNLKGGTVSQPDLFAAKTYKYSASVYVNTEAPQKPGYIFKGWDTASAATKVVYHPGDQYTAKKTVILYAVWEKKTCTVEYHFTYGDGFVWRDTVGYGESVTMPGPYINTPGAILKGWVQVDHEDDCWERGSSHVITQDIVLYSIFTAGNDKEYASHDFTGYQRVSGLKHESFITASTPDEHNVFGFDQYYFSDPELFADYWELEWAMYESKHPTIERDLYEHLTTDQQLITWMREKLPLARYEAVVALLGNNLSWVEISRGVFAEKSVDAFHIIDEEFKDSTSTKIKQYFAQEMSELIKGSCGIFAAVNTYLYLDGKGYTYSVEDVKKELLDYIKNSNGKMDWIERELSGGDGPISGYQYLMRKLSGCTAYWRGLAGVSYDEIRDMLDQDIPVILAFYRHNKAELDFYTLSDNTLNVSTLAYAHYFVVTGIYENPNVPDKHFLEVSSAGKKEYICWEEYIYGKGINAFSSYIKISFK